MDIENTAQTRSIQGGDQSALHFFANICRGFSPQKSSKISRRRVYIEAKSGFSGKSRFLGFSRSKALSEKSGFLGSTGCSLQIGGFRGVKIGVSPKIGVFWDSDVGRPKIGKT